MKLTAQHGDAPPVEFECFDTWLSRLISESILAGATYPRLPGIDAVSTIVDVGANCGAASVYFARCYPGATVHALEPGRDAFALLDRNARTCPNIRAYQVGLHTRDGTARLYGGIHDAATASIHKRPGVNTEVSEEISLREARAWLLEQGIWSIDLLKLDAEGCEVEILTNIRGFIPSLSVLYVEYDGIGARRRIDGLVDSTHELVYGQVMLNQGELIYVRTDLLRDSTPIVEFFERVAARDLNRKRASSAADHQRAAEADRQ